VIQDLKKERLRTQELYWYTLLQDLYLVSLSIKQINSLKITIV